ncbi:MAG: IS200/IS605 family transposase [Victivallales bacterium]|nr:IS200/IS605 family transposase [Victivallales bacterium]
MGHTYTSLHYHIVFSTKQRIGLISPELKKSLSAYIAKIINNEYGFARRIDGTDNHIHICADLKSRFSLSDILRTIKSNSSKWINANFSIKGGFAWQEGYGAFTVSKSSIPDVIKYIAVQEEHHKKMTFKEEFVKLLQKHEIKYDEKYIWN